MKRFLIFCLLFMGVSELLNAQVKVALLTCDKSSSCESPFTVNFLFGASHSTFNSPSDSIRFQILFGDGTSSFIQGAETDTFHLSISHTYNDYGNFSVTLIATAQDGSTDSIVRSSWIKISPCPNQGSLPLDIFKFYEFSHYPKMDYFSLSKGIIREMDFQ
jgi:PKD repeat protein